MKYQLRLLWQVQQLEQKNKLLEKQKSQVNMQEVREIAAQIKAINQKLILDRKNLQQLKNICDKKEVELADTTVKYHQLEKHLYNDDIRNLKEIEQIKAQYDAVKLDIDKLEQDFFNELDASDILSKKILDSEKLLLEKKVEYEKRQQEIFDKIADIDAEIAAEKTRYNDLLNKVDPQLFEKYDMLKRKMNLPIAEMKNGICGGCRMGLPEAQIASQGKDLNYCDHCGRILITIND